MTIDRLCQIVTALARDRAPSADSIGHTPSWSYQPMLELLAYLRDNGFKTYIVSGGGIEFTRPWTQRIYGIPPEQVVGCIDKTRFAMRDGRPVLFRLPEINFVDDGRQAGRHQRAYRPISNRRFRKLRWRPRDAAMDDAGRRSTSVRADRPPYRRRTRICLRPPISLRQAGPSARCRRREPLDRGQYER